MHRLCGRENTVFNIAASNPRHRTYRRMLHTGLNGSAVRDYWGLLREETMTMVDGFLCSRPNRRILDAEGKADAEKGNVNDKYEEHIRK